MAKEEFSHVSSSSFVRSPPSQGNLEKFGAAVVKQLALIALVTNSGMRRGSGM